MKFNQTYLVVIAVISLVSCNRPGKSKQMVPTETPNQLIITADCDDTYAPVTGNDKRCYLNECIALANGKTVAQQGHSESNFNLTDRYSWPIVSVCKPRQESWDTIPPIDLGDKTFIYSDINQKLYRGTSNRCRCLSAETFIDTPDGLRLVHEIKQDDLVFSLNEKNEKITAKVASVNKVAVEKGHRMLTLTLQDGRKLNVSPAHPAAHLGMSLDQFNVGDSLDRSIISEKRYSIMEEGFTYDIVPYSYSDCYWANGILIRSTMSSSFHSDRLLEMGW